MSGTILEKWSRFSVSKNFDTLLKNASIFSRGCRPLRALRRVKVRTVRPGLTARVHSAPLPLLPNKPASLGFVWVPGSHTCGLGSVFFDVHAAGKHDLTSSAVCGRRNSARLLQHKLKKYTLSTVWSGTILKNGPAFCVPAERLMEGCRLWGWYRSPGRENGAGRPGG